ncbi:MAG: type 4a pilus biogenesis protein PilO [bacterium]|nr:type 4a pilus biogenesis protein PilO [bacterium]
MDSITVFGRTFTWDEVRQGVLLLAAVLMLWGLYTEVVSRWDNFVALRDQKEAGERELEEAATLTATETEVRARRERAEQKVAAIRDRLPTRATVLPTLLVDLSEVFRGVHVSLRRFQPKEFTALERESLRDVGRVSVEIAAEGTYPAIIALFDRFSKYDRVLLVENPVLTPAGDSSLGIRPLGVTFTLTTYALNQ